MSDVVAQTRIRTRTPVGIPDQSELSGLNTKIVEREPVAPERQISVRSTQVSVDTFIAYLDNPKQRDTERHAVVASRYHLKQASPAQARAAAAQLGDTIYKLDGHTRAYLWANGRLTRPNVVNVDLYQCDTIDQVVSLYDAFDNKKAAETPADRLSGAMRLAGLHVESQFMKHCGFTSAFNCITHQYNSSEILSKQIAAYADEIRLLDEINLDRKLFKSGVFAGALLLVAKYGKRIIPFFEAYNNNRGIKMGGECDGVQALYELIANKNSRGGWSELTSTMRKTLSCGERWMAGENYKITRGGATVKETLHQPYLKKVA